MEGSGVITVKEAMERERDALIQQNEIKGLPIPVPVTQEQQEAFDSAFANYHAAMEQRLEIRVAQMGIRIIDERDARIKELETYIDQLESLITIGKE